MKNQSDIEKPDNSKKSMFASEGETRDHAKTFIGKNAIQVEPRKIRSSNGIWQFRAKEVDFLNNHVHLEKLNPQTDEVLENWRLN